MLRFGTAGLRGPVRDGPDGMNVTTVAKTSAAVARWLQERGNGGAPIVVGRDSRHGSAEFATTAAEVFAAADFAVTLLPQPLPTPVTAFAVRELGAAAGVQITASHNPASDNGYKVYVDDGAQLLAPADTQIEELIADVTEPIPRTPVTPSGTELLTHYLDRVAQLPVSIAGTRQRADIRIALTPLHGVGGDTAVEALTAAGFNDIHVVEQQYAPDPDFPTVSFPNPEEPGATDLLVELAENVQADIAIALDPDADRCAIGVPTPQGFRMLRGDQTGVLLADDILAAAEPSALVATTVVSSRLLSRLAPARGARYTETPTGFKWLARAGSGLVYAYEEAIGHCVDPTAVRDKDGIGTAVLAADLVARTRLLGRTLVEQLDEYAIQFGLHAGEQVSLRLQEATAATGVLERLRAMPPREIAGTTVEYTDLADSRGRIQMNALLFEGAGTRIVVRPSGTEPTLKCYLEVVEPVPERAALASAREHAEKRLTRLREFCRQSLAV